MSRTKAARLIHDEEPKRPDIFRYHEYRAYLKDWFEYLKIVQPGLSLRLVSSQAGLSAGYLPLVLSGQRNLSSKTVARLIPFLHLNPSEQTYLENLVSLGARDSIESQIRALAKMNRSTTYKKRNPNEVAFFKYMNHWYHIVIREMANLRDFKMDPAWIRNQLRVKLPLSTIKSAVEFLMENEFLSIDSKGKVVQSKELLKCDDAVFSKTLRYYHKQMLSLAAESMDNAKASERYLFGYTFSLNAEDFTTAQKILGQAIQEIESLQSAKKAQNSVYHLELGLFPLTESQNRPEPARGETEDK